MDLEAVLLQAIQDQPAEETAWLALADFLEEQGDPRGELLRLSRWLRGEADGPRGLAWEDRVRELLASGVRPCVPLLTNSIGMQLALIPAGTFLMGSPTTEAERAASEGPQHEVEITQPFYLDIYPVTQEQWQRVMGTNPSWFCSGGAGKDKVRGLDTRNFPVESVSWEDAALFCKRLSELPEEKREKRLYRLPTEAEWEYACRGGARSSTPSHFGASLSATQANFDGNYPYGGASKGKYLERTTPVGSYQPNPVGLYDMRGNVWEWCADWYDEDYYQSSPGKDPKGPTAGTLRVLRGGSWFDGGRSCRAACRDWNGPGNRNYDLGFRVALVSP